MDKIFSIKMDASDFMRQATAVKRAIEELNALRKQTDKDSPEYVALSVQLKRLRKEYSLLEKQLVTLSKQERDFNTVQEEAIKLLGQKAKTLEEIDSQNRMLREIARSLNLEDKEQLQLLHRINAKIEENIKLKKKESDVDIQRIMNIGNYASAFEGADPVIEKLAEKLRVSQELFAEVTKKTKEAGGGIRGFAKALKGLKFSIIIAAISLLISVLTRMRPVVEKVKQVWEFFVLIFEEIKTKIENLINYIGENWKDLLNPAVWLRKEWELIAKIGKALVTLDFSGFKNAWNGIKEGVKGTANEMQEMWMTAKRIVELQDELKSLNWQEKIMNEQIKSVIMDIEHQLKDKNISIEQGVELIRKEYAEQRRILAIREQELKKEIELLNAKRRRKELTEEELEQLKRFSVEQIKLANEKKQLDYEEADRIKSYREQREQERQARIEEQRRNAEQELMNAINLAKRKLEAELRIFKLKNREKLDLDKNFNKVSLEEFKKLLSKMKDFDLQILEKRKITEKLTKEEVEAEKLAITQKYADLETSYLSKVSAKQLEERRAKYQQMRDELDKAFAEMEWKAGLNDDEQTDVEKAEEQYQLINDEYSQELELLKQAREQELITEEEYQQRIGEVKLEYKRKIVDAELELERAKEREKAMIMQAEVNALKGFMNLAGEIFGKSKGLAVASAVIDTFVAANKVLAANPPLPAPVKIAEMITIVTTGLANVHKILAVKPPAGIGGGGSVGGGFASPNITVQSAAMNETPTEVITGTAIETDNANTVKVINVAKDTYDTANNDLFAENLSKI
jgi:diacylglycerol kinase